jgi:uncharacterized lipoprotein YddW (UPF0748 family)
MPSRTLRGVLALLLLAAPLGAPISSHAQPPPRIGLWIECEGKHRTLDDAARIRSAVEDAGLLGATDLFVQVFRNGKAWFHAPLADDTPHRRARDAGFDPLGTALERAHARGMRLHAWVNLLRIDESARAPLVRSLGRESVLADSAGRSLLDPGPWGPGRAWKPDTPGAWLDPASPAVAARLAAILEGLARAYPALDGIHLDYVRYPIAVRAGGGGNARGGPADLGWSPASRARFLQSGLAGADAHRARGDAWRRDRLTDLIRTLRARVRGRRRDLVLSAAVLPSPEEALSRARQDWPAWAAEGLLDLVVPMNYRQESVAFDSLARRCVARRGKAELLMGIGAWRFGDRMGTIASRVRIALDAGADGAVLFSHDNLRQQPDAFRRLGALLRAEILPAGQRAAPPPTSVAPE